MNDQPDQINIKKTSNQIAELKHPIVFLFNLITYKDELSDDNLSICLRLYLKYHTEIALEYNLKGIFKKELRKFKKSWTVLDEFYKLIDKKLAIILILKKFHLVYNNKKFWKSSINEQNDFLEQTKERFLGIYDCARGGIPYYIKLAALLKNSSNKTELLEDSKTRLLMILDMFGPKLFRSMDIPLITVWDYSELSNENLIKYWVIIFEKFSELLNQTIKLFDSYNLINIQINNLINPIIVKINSVLIDSETDPETENQDIKLFCNKF